LKSYEFGLAMSASGFAGASAACFQRDPFEGLGVFAACMSCSMFLAFLLELCGRGGRR